jgi:hypothetical protein
MPQYLMCVWFDDEYYSELDRTSPDVMRTDHQIDVLNEEMAERGIWVFAGGLEPVDSATVVRSNAGETSMTDGPYAESKEQMGGFWVIEVADLAAAREWARKAAAACERPIELRPIQG